MKRILSPALVILFVFFMLPKQRSFAREESEDKLPSLKWQKLGAGVSKTDLGPGLPEVAILKLSNEQFEKIYQSEAAAKAYLDSQKIFKQPLIEAKFCDVTPNKDGVGWILIIPHTLHSTASIVAWQLPATSK